MDVATGAMNRILKNIMKSPKQDLFVKVLENLPPTRDFGDAESIYKTIFDMYSNKGELFGQVVEQIIVALIRSLMQGTGLSDELKTQIRECLIALNREDPQGFYMIVSKMGEVVIQFVESLFS